MIDTRGGGSRKWLACEAHAASQNSLLPGLRWAAGLRPVFDRQVGKPATWRFVDILHAGISDGLQRGAIKVRWRRTENLQLRVALRDLAFRRGKNDHPESTLSIVIKAQMLSLAHC